MTIPKIIHQTWKKSSIPWHLSKYVSSWLYHNKEWQYMFWTDEKLDLFIKMEYPSLYETYVNLPISIMRIDIVRCCLLDKYGGIYVDLDFECFKSLDNLVKKGDLILSWEWEGANKIGVSGDAEQIKIERIISHYNIPRENPNTLGNAAMISTKGHHFWKNIIDDISSRVFPVHVENRDVWALTGPEYITNIFIRYFDSKWNARLLENSYLYPIPWHEPELSNKFEKTNYPDAYGAHHWAGSWWKKSPDTSRKMVDIECIISNPDSYMNDV